MITFFFLFDWVINLDLYFSLGFGTIFIFVLFFSFFSYFYFYFFIYFMFSLLIYRFQIKSYKIGSDRIGSRSDSDRIRIGFGSDSDQIQIKFNMIRSDLERIKIFKKKSDRIGFDLNPIRSDPCGTLILL